MQTEIDTKLFLFRGGIEFLSDIWIGLFMVMPREYFKGVFFKKKKTIKGG
jgi:hypothetical protein